jgi:hypothetical protein
MVQSEVLKRKTINGSLEQFCWFLFFNLLARFDLLLVLDLLLLEQPFTEELSVSEPMAHALGVEDDYDESSSVDLNAAREARTCSIGDACLDANVEIGFAMEKLMRILP